MDYMPDIISGARELRGGVPCRVAEERSFQGGSHRVFKLVFDDSVLWAARVCLRPEDWTYDLRAIRIFNHVKRLCPEIRAPNCYFKEECPVLYSEWVVGEPVAVWNLQIPSQRRHALLDDLAEFLLQLWTTPPPASPVPAQDTRYSAWLTQSLDRGILRTLRGKARWGKAIDYLIMRSFIPEYASTFDEYIGFGLAHGDLNAHNIMKNDDFRLTGYVRIASAIHSIYFQ